MAEPRFSELYTEELFQLHPQTVVVVESWNNLSPAETQLLSKILGAVRLNLEGVRIVEQAILNISVLSEKPKQLICFTKAATGLSLYEPIEADGILLVISDNLANLLNDEAARKKLWGALKVQFSV